MTPEDKEPTKQDIEAAKARILAPETPTSAPQELDAGTKSRLLAPERSTLGEIGSQLKAGVMVDLPKMVGQALQYSGDPGDMRYDIGKSIADYARREEQKPEYQPSPEADHNIVTRSLAGGARMLPQSVVPAAVAGLGMAALPVAAPLAVGGAAVLGSLPAAMAQGQETLDKADKEGVPRDAAIDAARLNALIEGGGETIGTLAGAKLLGLLGRAVGKETGNAAGDALAAATNTEVLKPFARQFPKTLATEVGTEMGQNAGQTAVENAYGIEKKETPWDAAKEAISPTIGMTVLMAPFGLAGHAASARNTAIRNNALASPDTPEEVRSLLADNLAKQIEQASPQEGAAFRANVEAAIANKQALTLDNSLFTPGSVQPGKRPPPDDAGEPDVQPPPPGPVPNVGPLSQAANLSIDQQRGSNVRAMPLTDKNVAQRQADQMTAASGVPHEVVPHPEAPGRWAAMPVQAKKETSDDELALNVGAGVPAGNGGADRGTGGATVSAPSGRGPMGTGPAAGIPDQGAGADAAAGNAGRERPRPGAVAVNALVQAVDPDSGETLFPSGARVRGFSEDGELAYVQGSEAGVPVSWLKQVAPPPTNTGAHKVTAESYQPKNDFDRGAFEGATSHTNERKLPSEGQIGAGNAKLGHATFQGLPIAIENARGSTRTGTDEDGKPWATLMTHHYGYIKRTDAADSTEAKRQGVDVMVGPNQDSAKVFVIDQTKADGSFDEHKTMVGFDSLEEAKQAYLDNYQAGWTRGEKITETTVDGLKDWLKKGDTKAPFNPSAFAMPAAQAPGAAPQSGPAAAQSQPAATPAAGSGPVRLQPAPVPPQGGGQTSPAASGPQQSLSLVSPGKDAASQPTPVDGNAPVLLAQTQQPTAPAEVHYPNRKLGFERARSTEDDMHDTHAWANITAANMQPGDSFRLNGGQWTVESVSGKTLKIVDANGLKRTLNPNGPQWGQFQRDLAGALQAQHLDRPNWKYESTPTKHPLLDILRRDPAVHVDEQGNFSLRDVAPASDRQAPGIETKQTSGSAAGTPASDRQGTPASRPATKAQGGVEVARDLGQYGQGYAEHRAKQVADKLSQEHPELRVEVEEVAPVNGMPRFAVVSYKAGGQVGKGTAPSGKQATGNPMVDNPASWVIREKATGKVIVETFDRKKVDALNTEKYEAVPIHEHLASLNKKGEDKEPSAKVVAAAKPVEHNKRVAIDRLAKTDPFRAFLYQHGLHKDDAPDAGLEKGKTYPYPGAGVIVSAKGKRLDELARAAHDAGWLTDADMESDTDNGGMNKLAGMIQDALDRKVVHTHPAAQEQQFDQQAQQRTMDALRSEAQGLGIDIDGLSDDEIYDAVRAKMAANVGVSEEEYDAASQEANVLEAGATADEIDRFLESAFHDQAEQQDLSDEDLDRIFGPDAAAAGARQGAGEGHDAGAAQDRGENPAGTQDTAAAGPDGRVDDGFALEAPTPESLKQQDARNRDQALADKQTADAQVDAFALTAPEGSVTGPAKDTSNPNKQLSLTEQADDEARAPEGLADGPVTPAKVPRKLPDSAFIAWAVEHVGEGNFRKIAQNHLNELAAEGWTVLPEEIARELGFVAEDLLWQQGFDGRPPRFGKEFDPSHFPPLPELANVPLGGPGLEVKMALFPEPGTARRNAVKQSAGQVLTQDEAAAKIEEWKQAAKAYGEKHDNSNKVILSLFDSSGIWSKPYEDAGYVVIRYDLNRGDNLVEDFPIGDIIALRQAGFEIAGVIAQPPCTSFASSGSQWWKTQHDAPSEKWVAKKYGEWATQWFDRPIEVATTLVDVAQAVIEFANPTEFYVLENPRGRIRRMTGLPESRMVIEPHVYGDAYTKTTYLYGEFNTDLPTANVSPAEEDGGMGSKIHKLTGYAWQDKEERSLTPEGFAYAFFMANHGRAVVVRNTPEQDKQSHAKTEADWAGRSQAARERLAAKRPERMVEFMDWPDESKPGVAYQVPEWVARQAWQAFKADQAAAGDDHPHAKQNKDTSWGAFLRMGGVNRAYLDRLVPGWEQQARGSRVMPATRALESFGRYGSTDTPLRFLSGMSAIGDIEAALAQGRSIGIAMEELSNPAWEALAKALAQTPEAYLFVDSGAIGAFKDTQAQTQSGQQNLSDMGEGGKTLDFERLMRRYEGLQEALARADRLHGADDGNTTFRAFFVMPDVVGNQRASLALIKRYAPLVNQYGAQAIVPLQGGELTLTQAFEQMMANLGLDPAMQLSPIIGVPSAREAVSDEELRALLDKYGDTITGVHILGALDNDKYEARLKVLRDARYDGDVSADANKLRAKVDKAGVRNQKREQLLSNDRPTEQPFTGATPFPSVPAAAKFAREHGLDMDVVKHPDGGYVLQPKLGQLSDKEKADGAKAVQGLNAALAAQGESVRVVPLRTAPAAEYAIARHVARLFGFNVHFIGHNNVFDGVALDNNIFLSEGMYAPVVAVAGHEATHALEQENPALYATLRELMRVYVREGVVDARRRFERSQGDTRADSQADFALHEIMGDINGAMWMDPVFWQQMVQKDENLFRRMAYHFMVAVTKALNAMRVLQGTRFDAGKLVTDLEAVRGILSDTWSWHLMNRDYQQGAGEAKFSRRAKAQPRVPKEQYRVLLRDHDNLLPAEKKAFNEFIKSRADGAALLARLKAFKGTPWARQAIEGVFVRQAIKAHIAGREPGFQSMLDNSRTVSAKSAIMRRGMEGLQDYLDNNGFIGDAEKPLHNVSSSFINCLPSRDCATFCYATKGHYRFAPSLVKSEMVTLAIEHDPIRAARRTAAEYKRFPEFDNERALRLFDKGDGDAAWVPYIAELNRQGIRTQIFSKNPAFLREVSDFNLRMLSVDSSNLALADAHQDLKVAFVYDGSESQRPALKTLLERDQLAVVLPLKLGRRVLEKPEVAALREEVPGIAAKICPIDAGYKKLGDWNCTKCDIGGGLGCFHGSVTKAVKALALRGEANPTQLAIDIEKLRKEWNERVASHLASNPGPAGNVADAGHDAAAESAELVRQIDALMERLLAVNDGRGTGQDAGQRDGGTGAAGAGAEKTEQPLKFIPRDQLKYSRKQFVDAKDSPLYLQREVTMVTDGQVAAAIARDHQARRVMDKGITLKAGDVIGARINLNVQKASGVVVQSIHRVPDGKTYDGYKKSDGRGGVFNQPVATMLKVVTIKDAYFNVSQVVRDKIVSIGPKEKTSMASVDGHYVPNANPSFDGVEIAFNPMKVHLFVDRMNRPVRYAEEVTVYGHRVYARGKIEYFTRDTAPAQVGSGGSAVLFADSELPTAVVPAPEQITVKHDAGNEDGQRPLFSRTQRDDRVPAGVAIAIAKQGTLHAALQALAEESPKPTHRVLAKRLAALNLPTRITRKRLEIPPEAMQRGYTVKAGEYDTIGDHLFLDERNGGEQTLLHEAVHAATMWALAPDATLTDAQSKGVEDLKRLYAEAAAAPGAADHYGVSNLAEFIAEAFSNPEFQRFLKSTNGWWSRLQNAIRAMLGLPSRSNLDMVLDAGHQLMAPIATQGRPNSWLDFVRAERAKLQPAARFSRAAPFYSELARRVDGMPMKSPPAQQWSKTIQALATKGVSAQEIQWTGVTDWLGLQTGKLSKQQVLDFLANNGVKVQEVMKGNDLPDTPEKAAFIANKVAEAEAEHEAQQSKLEQRFLDHWEGGSHWAAEYEDEDGRTKWAVMSNYARKPLELHDTEGAAEDAATALNDEQETEALLAYMRDYGSEFDRDEAEIHAAQEWDSDQVDDIAPKYEKYASGGGSHYRELLLTLPVNPAGRGLRHFTGWDDATFYEMPDGSWVDNADPDKVSESFRNEAELREAWTTYHGDGSSFLVHLYNGDSSPDYSSPHWDETNVLAHVRLDERMDAKRRRVLFVQEIQSDWAAEGREKGFRDVGEEARAHRALRDYSKQLAAKYDLNPANNMAMWARLKGMSAEEVAKYERLQGAWLAAGGGPGRKIPPEGPFVGATDSWVSLVLKRVIAYAAEVGADAVAIINGDQSADRYDLAKHVEQIRYIKYTPSGTYDVWASDEEGRALSVEVDKHGLTPEEVREFVGAEIAERIFRDEGRRTTRMTTLPERVLSGVDLKVGGEGMKAFYDKIVPKVARDVLRKLGGGMLTTVDFGPRRDPVAVSPEKGAPMVYRVYDRESGEWYAGRGSQFSWSEYERDASTFRSGPQADELVQRLKDTQLGPLVGFDITPALRDKAAQGLPLFSRKGPMRATPKPQPTYYSELARQVEALPLKQAPAGQWQGTINALVQKGVKPEEVEWTGIRDWLNLQTGKVEKQDVLKFLADHGVKVKEALLGEGRVLSFEEWTAAKGLSDEAIRDFETTLRRSYEAFKENLREGGTKYSNYTLPGADNYGELLLTLPELAMNPKQLAERTRVFDQYRARLDELHDKLVNDHSLSAMDRDAIHKRMGKLSDYRDQHARYAAGEVQGGYQSPHWEQPNVLAHVRFNERTDADGRRVLMIEELQSDWAATARRKGVRPTAPTEAELAYANYLGELPKRAYELLKREFMDDGVSEAQAEKMARNLTENATARHLGLMLNEHELETSLAAAAYDSNAAHAEDKVAPAPFITRTESWLALALKRMIRYAADMGFERVAIINGQQSADRYNLSYHVKTLSWMRFKQGWQLEADTRQGGEPIRYFAHSERELENLVGKDIADKIVKGVGRFQNDRSPHPRGMLDNLQLRVGGRGMIDFYDSIVPNVLAKVLKKIGGPPLITVDAGVRERYFEGEGEDETPTGRPVAVIDNYLNAYTMPMPDGSFDVFDRHGNLAGNYKAENADKAILAAQHNIASFGNGGGMGRYSIVMQGTDVTWGAYNDRQTAERRLAELQAAYRETPHAQVGFDMTPALKARARQGLPLFSRTGDGVRRAGIKANVLRLADILGPQLYGDMREMGAVTVKELFQNSFDGVKDAMLLDGVKEGAIHINLDRGQRLITVEDNGHGMSADTVANAFLSIAGSEKASGRSSGGFGVAKALFLFGNKRLHLETVRDGTMTIMDTSGEELKASAADPEQGPEIKTVAGVKAANGTKLQIWIPDTYLDENDGQVRNISFPAEYDVKNIVKASPLFENVWVTVNGNTMPVGRSFPKDEFVPFANVKFNWGTARIIVSKDEVGQERYANNGHVLANGIWQFDFKVKEDPFGYNSAAAPRNFYLNLEPKLEPSKPGYPIAVNRQDFSPAARDDMRKVINYLSVIYGRSKARDDAEGFGRLEYVEHDGSVKESLALVPEKNAEAEKNLLRIQAGDRIEVVEGRLIVNGREVPELTPAEIRSARMDLEDFRIAQDRIDFTRPLVHDAMDLPSPAMLQEMARLDAELAALKQAEEAAEQRYAQAHHDEYWGKHDTAEEIARAKATTEEADEAWSDAKLALVRFLNTTYPDRKAALEEQMAKQENRIPFVQALRAQFGRRADAFLGAIGRRFMGLRDVVGKLDLTGAYDGLAGVPVGVSFDEKYYGVHTYIPFQAMMVNPAISRADQESRSDDLRYVATLLTGTMVHEIVHFVHRNHDARSFIPELQRLMADLTSHASFDLGMFRDLVQADLEKYRDVYLETNRLLRSGVVANRGAKLKDAGDFDARTDGPAADMAGAGRAGQAGPGVPGKAEPGDRAGAAVRHPRDVRGGAEGSGNLKFSRKSKKWTAEEADAFTIAHEDVFAQHGFTPRMVGGLRFKKGRRKDADIVLDPMQPRTFEQAHAAIEEGLVPDLGAKVVQEMLESGDVPGSYFIGVELPNGKYVEFILEDSSHPSEVDIQDGAAKAPTHAQPRFSRSHFAEWFAGSKVVDAEGRPLRVYHGTGDDFASFRLGRSGRRQGFYFAAEPGVAGDFAGMAADSIAYEDDEVAAGPNIIPAYLSLKSPLDVTNGWPAAVKRELERIAGAGAFSNDVGDFWQVMDAGPEVTSKLEELGYDGLVAAENGKRVYVALRPDQIRFAVSEGPRFSRVAPQPQEFLHWFGDSRVVDADGKPLVVYRGEHGLNDGSEAFHTRAGSIAFGSRDAANLYATRPNDSRDVLLAPRVLPAYLRIERPFLDNRDDPFLDLSLVQDRLGRDEALRIAKKFADHVENTNNWEDIQEESHAKGVADFLAKHPERLGDLYFDAYPFFDDADEVARLKRLGYDGAIHMGNGATALDLEYRIFSASQAWSAGSPGGQAKFSRIGTAINDALAFIGSPGAVRDFAGNARALLRSDRAFNVYDRTLSTQHNKALKDADFKRVFDAVQARVDETAHYAIEAERKAPGVLVRLNGTMESLKAMFGSAKQYEADMEAIAKPLFENIEGVTGVRQFVFNDHELRTRYHLNERQIGMYRQVRESVDASIDRLAQTTVLAVAEAVGVDITDLKDRPLADTVQAVQYLIPPHTTLESRIPGTQGTLAGTEVHARIEGIVQTAAFLKMRGYMPAMRFGQYAVTVRDPADNNRVVHFSMHETQLAANAARFKAQRDFPDMEVTSSVMNDERYQAFKGVSPETVELFARFSGMDQSEAYHEYIALAKAARSAMTRELERKGIAGFSRDVPRVLSTFILSNSRQSALNVTGGRVSAALSSPALAKKGDVEKEAQRLVAYMDKPQEEAAALRGFMFYYFIGGSVASAITNLTQPVLMTLPWLSQYAGMKAPANLLDAARMAASGRVADPELKRALERADAEGRTEPKEIHSLMADADSSLFQRSQRTRAIAAAWGSFFSQAERFNRKVTFLAAYRTAQQMGAQQLSEAGFANAYEFAVRALNDTQGLYNKANRPNLGRGPIGAVALTFKQFSLIYLEMIARMPWQQKAIAASLMVLAAGVQGLPFAEDFEDLIDAIGQALGFNTNTRRSLRRLATKTLGETGSEMLLHGVLRPTGVDVAGRLSMGSPLVQGAFGLLKKADDQRDVKPAFGGPLESMLGSFSDAWQRATVGDLTGALKAAAPTAVRSATQGVEMALTGQYRDRADRNVMPVNKYESAVKFFGFQPARVAQQSNVLADIRQDENLMREVKTALVQQWASAIVDKDMQRAERIKGKWRDWNATNPDTLILIRPNEIRDAVKERILDRATREIKKAPKQIKGVVVDELRIKQE